LKEGFNILFNMRKGSWS